MTESGNHGGSSYEEVDSLALFISPEKSSDAPASHMTANQVDIAPTLALLFGVPIPKNSVGFLMAEAFKSLRVDRFLRLLELNSWQLMRLIQAQRPHLECGTFSCDVFQDSDGSLYGERDHNMEDICCSYIKADEFHKSLKSKGVSSNEDDYSSRYFQCFLKSASEWLSHRATDKPVGFLTSGLGAMLLSCLVFMGLLSYLVHKVYMKTNNLRMRGWQLDEIFTLTIVFVVILSMGSSSMVLPYRKSDVPLHATRGIFGLHYIQTVSIIVVLISGRFLRGWHQGGINWVHLPDISKWLEQAGSDWIMFLQLLSGVLMIIVCFVSLMWPLMLKKKFFMPIALVFLVPGLMVLQHILEHNDGITATSSLAATISAQKIYSVLAICGLGTLLAVPWFVTFQNDECAYNNGHTSDIFYTQKWHFYLEFKDCAYAIGWAYIFCWCLLQLLLQQPVNSVPILLLLIQNICSICFFRCGDPLLKQWVEVAALYYLGLAGHFGLGNTNSLATIDVAGAFIGVSSYSTFLSGILMFIITYGSPLLAFISMLIYISVKDINMEKSEAHMNFGQLLMLTTGFPFLVPLALNSIFLIAYTIVLLLMRNHLFIWSVFSPKYLYVCAATACVYISLFLVALSMIYIYTVLIIRGRWKLTGHIHLRER
ncbi:hypothetical protein Leryth_008432 [Lithospermum erythrorhizon]|nr:hypothetical protein Leryth_008432 [Lithospermum erythrorhizon]